MTSSATPVISSEDKASAEFSKRPKHAPKGERNNVWNSIFGRVNPRPPEPAPKTPLEANLRTCKQAKAHQDKFTPPSATQQARIKAEVLITEQELSILKPWEARFHDARAKGHQYNFHREDAAKREFNIQVERAMREGGPIPTGFSVEQIRAENAAVQAAVQKTLRDLRAEAFPMVIELGVRFLDACNRLAEQADAEEKTLAAKWGVDSKASTIGNAYRGVAAYLATYLPESPSTLHSISTALPLLAEDLKAK